MTSTKCTQTYYRLHLGASAPENRGGNGVISLIGVSGPQNRFILVHARMKMDLVKKFAAKLSKLFSRGPADFATISPPYDS